MHWTFSAATLQILFMLKQQHYTLTNVKKVKSQSTTPLMQSLFAGQHSSNISCKNAWMYSQVQNIPRGHVGLWHVAETRLPKATLRIKKNYSKKTHGRNLQCLTSKKSLYGTAEAVGPVKLYMEWRTGSHAAPGYELYKSFLIWNTCHTWNRWPSWVFFIEKGKVSSAVWEWRLLDSNHNMWDASLAV